MMFIIKKIELKSFQLQKRNQKKKFNIQMRKQYTQIFLPKKERRLNFYFSLIPMRSRVKYPFYRIVVLDPYSSIIEDLGFYDPFNAAEYFTCGSLALEKSETFNVLIDRRCVTIDRDRTAFWLSTDYQPIPSPMITAILTDIALMKINEKFITPFFGPHKPNKLENTFFDFVSYYDLIYYNKYAIVIGEMPKIISKKEEKLYELKKKKEINQHNLEKKYIVNLDNLMALVHNDFFFEQLKNQFQQKYLKYLNTFRFNSKKPFIEIIFKL